MGCTLIDSRKRNRQARIDHYGVLQDHGPEKEMINVDVEDSEKIRGPSFGERKRLRYMIRWRFRFEQSGEEDTLLAVLPEVIGLQHVIENSDWHNDSPFEQSLRLYRWVRQLPSDVSQTVSIETETMQTALSRRTDASNGRHSTQQLLAFAALVHDVGKRDTWSPLEEDATTCIGHEEVGAQMAPALCDRFDFTPAEKTLVVRLVAGHGEPYTLFKRIAPLPELERVEHLRRFEEAWGDDLLLLLLLAYGDLVTSHLGQRRPEKYAAVLAFYQDWLRRLQNKKAQNQRGGQTDETEPGCSSSQ